MLLAMSSSLQCVPPPGVKMEEPRLRKTPRRRLAYRIPLADLVKFPKGVLLRYLTDSGMDSDENDKAEVDEIWAAWTSPENIIGRMPEYVCDLGAGKVKEFKDATSGVKLSANAMRYLRDERERRMNRLQKRNSRKRNDSGKSKGRRGSSADEDDDEDDGSGDSHSGTTHRSRSQSVNSAGSESAAAISRGLSNLGVSSDKSRHRRGSDKSEAADMNSSFASAASAAAVAAMAAVAGGSSHLPLSAAAALALASQQLEDGSFLAGKDAKSWTEPAPAARRSNRRPKKAKRHSSSEDEMDETASGVVNAFAAVPPQNLSPLRAPPGTAAQTSFPSMLHQSWQPYMPSPLKASSRAEEIVLPATVTSGVDTLSAMAAASRLAGVFSPLRGPGSAAAGLGDTDMPDTPNLNERGSSATALPPLSPSTSAYALHGVLLEQLMGPHSPSGPNDVNVLMGIQSPATHQNGQPSPFYLHAMTSPVAAGVQIPSSAYALLSTFFSPQRTSAPTSADDAPDIVGTRGGSTSSRNLPTSALRQGSSAASNAVVVTAAAAAAAEFASKVGPISPTKDGHGTAPTTPSGNTRLTNRRFSSGTPLASPGRPQPPSRKSSKDLLFDYANVPKIKETADDKDQKENQMAGVVVVEAAAADSGADGLATVTRVTSTAVSADAQPL